MLESIIKASMKVITNENIIKKVHLWIKKWFDDKNNKITSELLEERIILFKYSLELHLNIILNNSINTLIKQLFIDQLLDFMGIIDVSNVKQL